MTSEQNQDIESVMQRAIAADIGVLVETNDVEAFQRRFYALKRDKVDNGATEFASLSISRSRSHADQILIIDKKEQSNG